MMSTSYFLLSIGIVKVLKHGALVASLWLAHPL